MISLYLLYGIGYLYRCSFWKLKGVIKNKWIDFRSIKFKANSTIAEMYSIMKSLNGISYKFPEVKKVNIYTDSLSSYNFINEVGWSKCKLIARLSDSIRKLISDLHSEGIEVNVMWVRGHDGCYYNEKVDLMCKASYEAGIKVVSSSHS